MESGGKLPTNSKTLKCIDSFVAKYDHLTGETTVIRLNTEKYIRDLIESTRYQIVFTIFQLIWILTNVRLDPNQSENGKYKIISG